MIIARRVIAPGHKGFVRFIHLSMKTAAPGHDMIDKDGNCIAEWYVSPEQWAALILADGTDVTKVG